MKIISNRKTLLLAGYVLCLTLTLTAILVAWFSPAKGYENSVYSSTPQIVWYSVIGSAVIALLLVFHQLLMRGGLTSRHWLIGLSILVIDRLVVLYLPFIRGYYTYSGDNMTNIGNVLDVVLTGHIAPGNFYPVVHILLGTSAIISGGDVVLFSNISTPMMSCFFILGLYLLARRVSSRPDVPVLVAVIAAPVMFNGYDIYLMPNGWSILYMPFAVYAFFRFSKSFSERVAAITVISVFPFFHPLSCLYLAGILVVCGVVVIVETNAVVSWRDRVRRYLPFVYALLLLLILFPWILSFQQFQPNLQDFYKAFTQGSSPNVIDQMASTLGMIHVGLSGFLLLLLKSMGDDIIFLIPSVIVCFVAIKRWRKERGVQILTLAIVTMCAGILYAGYLFNLIPGLAFLGADRLLAFAVVFTPILFSLWILGGYHFPRAPFKARAALSVALVLLASTISILSVFPSPYVINPNMQVTHMDEEGFHWLFDKEGHAIPVVSIMSSPRRYAGLILGTVGSGAIEAVVSAPPDHFGRGGNSSSESWVISDTYLVLSEIDRTTYSGVWSSVGRFSQSDFESLAFNISYQKVSSNGECDVWYVLPSS